MNDWLLRQLNLDDDLVRHVDQAALRFQSPRTLVAGLLLLVPVAVFIWLRQNRNLANAPRPLRFTLSATRILILLLLVVVLGSPYLELDLKAENRAVVAVVMDQSQSMDLPAGPFAASDELAAVARIAGYRTEGGAADAETRKALNRMSRAKLTQAALQANAELFARLAKKYDVQFRTFSGESALLGLDPQALKVPEPPVPGGAETRIGDVITRVNDEAAGRQVAGILLFSDGENNAGRGATEAAAASGERSTPVYAVPVGTTRRLLDVSIADVFAPSLVTIEDTVRVNVTVESFGFDARAVKVQLKDGETLLDEKDLTLSDKEQQTVELTFKATQPGTRYLTVSIPPQPEEADHLRANNADAVVVRVSEERIKLLYVEGRPHWDFRFLKNALRRDNGIGGRLGDGKQPDIVLETEWRRLPAPLRSEALPSKLEDLAVYHAVVVGDASPELLTPEFVALLDKAVREKGVGLIVQAGTLNTPHRHPEALSKLLPVELVKGKAGRYPRGAPSFKLELAPEGATHEATRFYDDAGRNQTAWLNLPPYYWAADTTRPAPGASVLVHNPVQTAFGKAPLIAHHFAGAGRVLFVGTDETFRWRQNVGERFFYRFWGQSARFVARRDARGGKKSWIEVRPPRARPGEPVEVELMAFTAKGEPAAEAKQMAQVIGGGKQVVATLSADPLAKGRYVGRFTAGAVGDYEVTFTPDGQDKAIAARLRVAGSAEEMRSPNVNRESLARIATASGGRVVELPDLASIERLLEGKSRYTDLHRESLLWDNWLTLALLIGLYALDVGLRRLSGLS